MMTASIFRMIDANLNRAREGIRVVEDFARFALNHPDLSRRCKTIRHELQKLARRIEQKAGLSLTAFRDTRGDVGTRISSRSEQSRCSAVDLLCANFKRVQESLRVLEEQGKPIDPGFGPAFERMRYSTYALEDDLLRLADHREKFAAITLGLVLNPRYCKQSPVEIARQALAGGVRLIQLRVESRTDQEFLKLAESMRKVVHRRGGLFIVERRSDIAFASSADGVFVRPGELSVGETRTACRDLLIVGTLVKNQREVKRAEKDEATYVVVDTLSARKTKPPGAVTLPVNTAVKQMKNMYGIRMAAKR